MTEAELLAANDLLRKENERLWACVRRGLAGFVIVGALLAAGWSVSTGVIGYENNKTLRALFQEQTKQIEMVRGKP